MKSKFLMLMAAGLTFSFIACNDANTASEADKDKDATVTPAETPATVEAPATARTSFETKYPNATNVKWDRYTPADKSTLDPADWNYNLDANDYVVTFDWEGAPYYAWYDDGNWVHASTRVSDHSKLPASVNDVIRNKFAGYTIVEVDKEHDKDRTTYEVDLEKGEDKMKVHFDENGKIVKQKGKVDGEKTKTKEEDKH
jgi:hypothetical protein